MHKYLFEAIVEVLGDAVTDEVAAAWDEVYWEMADTMIAMDKDLYAEAGVPAGDPWREVVAQDGVRFPLIGMLHYLARTSTDRQVTVLHADRSPARHAHRQELAELVARLPGSSMHENLADLCLTLRCRRRP